MSEPAKFIHHCGKYWKIFETPFGTGVTCTRCGHFLKESKYPTVTGVR